MTIRSKPATQEYRDNWDRVFGKKARRPKYPRVEEWEGRKVVIYGRTRVQGCVTFTPAVKP